MWNVSIYFAFSSSPSLFHPHNKAFDVFYKANNILMYVFCGIIFWTMGMPQGDFKSTISVSASLESLQCSLGFSTEHLQSLSLEKKKKAAMSKRKERMSLNHPPPDVQRRWVCGAIVLSLHHSQRHREQICCSTGNECYDISCSA